MIGHQINSTPGYPQSQGSVSFEATKCMAKQGGGLEAVRAAGSRTRELVDGTTVTFLSAQERSP